MFKKINSTTLIILFLVLAGIVAFNKFYLSKRGESTFNDQFVKIDPLKVTQIIISPKAESGKEIKLTKQGNNWLAEQDKMKAEADTMAIRNLINNFTDIKSSALAGADKTSWAGFQISDSSGSRIRIMTSDNNTYDMVIGKFGYNQAARNGITYIRRKNEEAVYAIAGFLSFAVNQPFNRWRNKTLIHGKKENWNTLTFSYPGDSSFVLTRQSDGWTVNDKPVDTVAVNQYLTELSNMQGNDFVDQYSPGSIPVYTLTVQGNNQPGPITVVAYPGDSMQKLILHSSLNADAYFVDGKSRVAERIFVSSRKFLPGGIKASPR